jgi:hypothetical protein
VKQKRKTEISLQLSEVVAIRTQKVWLTWCPACRRQVRMISSDDAALATGQAAREIFRLVEAGRLHFKEDENGLLYICFESLQRLVGNERAIECENESDNQS